MKMLRRSPMPMRVIYSRREIIRRIRYLSPEKLEIVLNTINELDTDTLTKDDIAAIEEGKRAIKKGDTISLEQFCKDAKL